MRTEIENLTRTMVAIPSFSGEKEENRQVLGIAQKFLGFDIYSKTFEHNGVISQIWGDPTSLLTPRLLLSGHIDVVGVDGDESLFTMEQDKEILKGRGVGDMKGHVAAMLMAYKRWHKEQNGANGVGLVLTSDEEIGGFNGTRYLVEQGLKPEVVFIPDGAFDFDIVESQKAPHHIIVKADGSGGHASQSFALDNPLNRLVAFYTKAREQLNLATREQPWASTFEMTVMQTPNTSKNKIPNTATATFSWRWPLEQLSFHDGRSKIEAICKEFHCEVIGEEGQGEGCLTDRYAPFVTEWKNVIEETIGRNVGFQNMHGATDGRHFYNSEQYGSKKILVTSAKTDGHHGPEEWIDLQSLVQLAEGIYRYIKEGDK